jgi:hypothetical protein
MAMNKNPDNWPQPVRPRPLEGLTAKDINAALADAHTRNDPHWTMRTMEAGLLNRWTNC